MIYRRTDTQSLDENASDHIEQACELDKKP